MNEAIKISELKKTYHGTVGIDGVNLSVPQNIIFGIIGPDGAGKTTTIRLLCGLLKSDSGKAEILGLDLDKDIRIIRKQIGYLSQRFSLYGDLSVDENIEFFAEIHGVKDFNNRRNELLEFTRLTAFRKYLAANLSGGMKQKLALACTLIHRPRIIFLDEPTTGVDPVSRRDFWVILSGLLKEQITMFISTPYLDEAERFHKIAFLNNGKILESDSPDNIKKKFNKQILEVFTSNVRVTFDVLRQETGFEIQLFGDRIDIVLNELESDIINIKKILSENNIDVLDTRLKSASLENVFINLLKK